MADVTDAKADIGDLKAVPAPNGSVVLKEEEISPLKNDGQLRVLNHFYYAVATYMQTVLNNMPHDVVTRKKKDGEEVLDRPHLYKSIMDASATITEDEYLAALKAHQNWNVVSQPFIFWQDFIEQVVTQEIHKKVAAAAIKVYAGEFGATQMLSFVRQEIARAVKFALEEQGAMARDIHDPMGIATNKLGTLKADGAIPVKDLWIALYVPEYLFQKVYNNVYDATQSSYLAKHFVEEFLKKNHQMPTQHVLDQLVKMHDKRRMEQRDQFLTKASKATSDVPMVEVHENTQEYW